MQKILPTLNPVLLGALLFSLLLHGSLFGIKSLKCSTAIEFDSGDISVELRLAPSIASVAKTEPVPVEPEPPVEIKEVVAEIPTPIPAPIEPDISPTPEPISELLEPTPPEPVPEILESDLQTDLHSVDQEGSLEKEKGVFSDAQTKTRCCPVYPWMSRRKGEEGIVTLSVEVSISGQGEHIKIIQSSGYPRLDKAAIKALSDAHFSPALLREKPQVSTLIETFNFQLKNAQ